MNTQLEKKNTYTSLGITIAFHLGILLICAFFLKIMPPNPPLPEYGVEVNFGVDTEGFGSDQSTPSTDENTLADASLPAQDAQQAPNEEPNPTNASQEQNIATTNNPESTVELPETKKQNTNTQKGTGGNDKQQKEATPLDYGKKSSITGNGNNGNKEGTTGDMGNPKGSLSSLNYEGQPGSGGKGGASLSLAGWNWDDKPNKVDPYNESGRLSFEISVDSDGNVVGVRVLEKTVSQEVVNFYKKQVEELTFSRTGSDASEGSISKGKITFVITGK